MVQDGLTWWVIALSGVLVVGWMVLVVALLFRLKDYLEQVSRDMSVMREYARDDRDRVDTVGGEVHLLTSEMRKTRNSSNRLNDQVARYLLGDLVPKEPKDALRDQLKKQHDDHFGGRRTARGYGV